VIRLALAAAVTDFESAVDYVVANFNGDIRSVFAGSVPYLRLAGVVFGGWQMARAAQVASRKLAAGVDADFMRAKIATARFYVDHILSSTSGLRVSIVNGAPGVLALAPEQF
jgi:butyryl-CoA dehydrogenase